MLRISPGHFVNHHHDMQKKPEAPAPGFFVAKPALLE
jgi:hypothetical protein